MATKPSYPVLNSLVQSKTKTRPLSKSMKCFFVMIHVIFALDFGFIKFKSSKINVLVKLITLTHATSFCVALGLVFLDPSNDNSVFLYHAFFLVILIYYVFALTLLVPKNTFHDYQTDLNSFDAEIGVDSSTCRVGNKIIIWFLILCFFFFSLRIANCALLPEYCTLPIYVDLMYYAVTIGLDTVLIVYTHVFYSGYLRLKNFTTFVNDDGTDIISCQYLYKNVAGLIEKAKKSFDVVLIFALVSNTVNVTLTCYSMFLRELDIPFGLCVALSLVVSQRLLMLFSPAVTAGLLALQVEQIKLVLYNKLVQDQTHAKDIKRFVGYIEGRPLRFKVWRVVPLDWRLPVVVINVSVTYLIVLIQFTHKKN